MQNLIESPNGQNTNDLYSKRSQTGSAFSLPLPTVKSRECQPLIREMSEPKQFPTECLGPILGPAAKKAAELVQVPEALAANSFLTAATLAVQAHANVSIDDRIHPISEYFVSIAMTGDRKDAIDDVTMGQIYKRQLELELQHKIDLRSYLDAKDTYDSKRSSIIGNNESKSKSADDIKNELKVLGDEPKAPISSTKIISDLTIEGVMKYLVDGQPSIAIVATEGGQIIGGYGFSKDNILKTAAGLSKLWDGKPLTSVRSVGGSISINNRRVSMHLMIQPNLAPLLIGNKLLAEQGLLSRFLVSWPQSLAGKRLYSEDTDAPSETIASANELIKYNQHISEILMLPEPRDTSTGELAPRIISPDQEAMKLWRQCYNETEKLQARDQKLYPIKGFASKAAEHTARVAGAITLFQDVNATSISAETMANAIKIIHYYIDEALRIHGTGTVNKQLQEANDLYQWLKLKNKKEITLIEIYKYGPNWIRDAQAARRVVAVLIDTGHMERLPNGLEFEGHVRSEAYKVLEEV